MLRPFYLYLVININLRVNCVFVVTQVEDAIKSSQKHSEKPSETRDLLGFLSQKYSEKSPETQELLSLVGRAMTDNPDSGSLTVEKRPIAEPVTFRVNGGAETGNMQQNPPPLRPANSAKNQIPRNVNAGARKTNQNSGRSLPAKAAKKMKVSAESSHILGLQEVLYSNKLLGRDEIRGFENQFSHGIPGFENQFLHGIP
ncbi:hypothetical protein CROQUDRAFT_137239, partial [Cronartium quercuum f. sp. fusiforme G11]